MPWTKILFIIAAAAIAWLIYRSIRGKPQAFSRHNLGKSLQTLGVLSLILIIIIGLAVLLLRN